MPAPLKSIDWDHAINLFNQGLKIPRIAELIGAKPNTVATKAARGKWREKRDRAVQAVSEVVQNMVKTRPKSIQERADKWVEREITRVERITDALDSVQIPKEITKLREHVEVSALNGKYGRSTFGLDAAGQSITLNVGVLSRGELMPTEQIIDVQPEQIS